MIYIVIGKECRDTLLADERGNLLKENPPQKGLFLGFPPGVWGGPCGGGGTSGRGAALFDITFGADDLLCSTLCRRRVGGADVIPTGGGKVVRSGGNHGPRHVATGGGAPHRGGWWFVSAQLRAAHLRMFDAGLSRGEVLPPLPLTVGVFGGWEQARGVVRGFVVQGIKPYHHVQPKEAHTAVAALHEPRRTSDYEGGETRAFLPDMENARSQNRERRVRGILTI